MARPKSDNPRKSLVGVHCNQSEKEALELKAKAYNMSVSKYLRELGLGYPIHAKIDQLTLLELSKAKSDLGRLGGLFKKWLVDNKEHKYQAKLGSKNYLTVNKLVEDMENKEKELLEIARKLIK